jgi:hypothetical protein
MLPNTTPANRLSRATALAVLGFSLLGAGCMHDSDDEMTSAVVSGEKSVSMEGSDLFFGGKVGVKVTLSRGIGHGLHKDKGGHDKDYTYQKYTTNESKQMLGSPLPPVTLHLILTNRSQEPVTVSMIDFDSEMGNFAVDPDTLTIAPGQSGEPTSMVSDLGVSSDTIMFKVTLKYGATKESRSFPVGIVAPSAAPSVGK